VLRLVEWTMLNPDRTPTKRGVGFALDQHGLACFLNQLSDHDRR